MKQNLNEIRRMQQLAGLITESKLLENELSQAEATADKVADRLEDKVAQLSPEQIDQLKAELSQLGITADTPIEQAAEEIKDEIGTDQLGEAVSSSRKIGSILGSIGTGLIGSLLVPIIPVAVGLGVGSVAGGFAITFATAALLKGLAKALGDEKPVSENDELFEIRQLVREVIKESILSEEKTYEYQGKKYKEGDKTKEFLEDDIKRGTSKTPITADTLFAEYRQTSTGRARGSKSMDIALENGKPIIYKTVTPYVAQNGKKGWKCVKMELVSEQ